MNGALVLLALAGHADSIHVRGVARDTTLAVVATAAGDAIRADVVLPLLGGVARIAGFGRWIIEVQGTSLGLVEGVPFATNRGATIPIAAAPRQQDGALLLPMQLLADLVPRLGGTITWDSGRRELRVARFATAVIASPRPLPATSPSRGVVPAVTSSRPSAPARAASSRQWTVVVDAGHGGVDPGMRGPIGGRFTIFEKDITLGVAKRLAHELDARGVNVVMTRTSDTLIALADRGRIANQHQGNLFISIHVNAANPNWKDPRSARGFETYFLAEARTEDDRRVAKMENEVVRFESGPAERHDDALGFILSDMRQNEHLRESNDLAEYVQAQLAKIHPGPSRGVKQAGFVVLVTSFMPSVLVEIGFGSNPAEAAWISGDDGQRVIAGAVATAALAYVAHYERRVGGPGGAAGTSALPPR
jgi:N-acetylmuramoyl-L-alanine amidase